MDTDEKQTFLLLLNGDNEKAIQKLEKLVEKGTLSKEFTRILSS